MAETDRLRLLAEARRRQASAGQVAAPQQQIVGTFSDSGRVLRMPDGTLQAVSAGGATTNQESIARIMAGDGFSQITQDSFDQQRLSGNMDHARAGEIAHGLPFVGSYVDEAFGAISPQKGENVRALHGAMERQHPKQSAALNVAGGVLGAVPMAVAAAPTVAAAAPVSLGAQALAGLGGGAVAGATEGAIYGYGEGQGDERAQNATQGAMIGGGAGAVLGAAAPYAAAGIKNLVTRLRGSDVAVIQRELNVSREAATTIRNTLASGDDNAAMAAIQRAGDDAMLADAGLPAKQLLDASAATGGPAAQIAREAVGDRTQRATGQMTAALDDVFGPPRGEQEIIDAVRSGTAPARSAAYDAAYSTPINYAEGAGRRLENLMGRVPAQAIRKAQEIMDLREEVSSQIMATIADDGRVTFQQMPDVRQTHYIMQALDDMAKSTDGTGTFGRQNTYGSSVEGLRRDIANTLKSAVPEFSAAQDIAADTAKQIEMTQMGYDMLRAGTRREDVASALSGASKAEREAAMQGVRSYIDDTTANVARTITDPDTTTREGIRVLRDFSTRANQTKMRALLGQEQADTLLSQIDEAATAFELRAAIAENSKTAIRQEIQGAARDVADGGIVRQLGQGEPVNATKRLVQAMTGETAEARQIRGMGLYEEIARALTQERGSRAQAALTRIQSAMNGQPLSENSAKMIANTITGAAFLSGNRATSTALQ